MNRMIAALVEQIREEMTVTVIKDFFVSMFSDIINNPPEEGTRITYSMSCSQLVDVGAFWRHPDLFEAITSELTGRMLHEVYGDVSRIVAREAEDLIAIASSLSDVMVDARPLVAAELDAMYPGLDVNVAKAVMAMTLLDQGYEAMREALVSLVDSVDEAPGLDMTTDNRITHAAPATVQ